MCRSSFGSKAPKSRKGGRFLAESGVAIIGAKDLTDAANKVVKAAG